MPTWKFYHPDNVFMDPDEKQALSQAITDIYTGIGLPAFYVAVLFIPQPPNTIYRGGAAQPTLKKPPYIRIMFSHIARHFEAGESEEKTNFMDMVNRILKSFIADKGWDWEIDGTEGDLSFLRVQGMKIPPPGSEAEKLWKREDRPVPYTL
ncbi:putative oxalocrotonate tautomerase [Macrophomina phaseolina]|uniref:Oxalocrotonate tautomerase n=1 Tax=Macrophomina phaseolina TaxID=35725 RepID=A0ABQ8G0G7_9PEZI|nr:putative oxalocrotonate tautomerase [Macrophomina phaseolina]